MFPTVPELEAFPNGTQRCPDHIPVRYDNYMLRLFYKTISISVNFNGSFIIGIVYSLFKSFRQLEQAQYVYDVVLTSIRRRRDVEKTLNRRLCP